MKTSVTAVMLATLLVLSGQMEKRMVLIERNNELILLTGGAPQPIKCNSSVLFNTLRLTKILEHEYKVETSRKGAYWCLDANHEVSNWFLYNPRGIHNQLTTQMPDSFEDYETSDEELDPHTSASSRLTCPSQPLRDERGVLRHWPAMTVGEVHLFVHNNSCVEAARLCTFNIQRNDYTDAKLVVPQEWNPEWPPPCPMVDIRDTAHQLDVIANKSSVTPSDLQVATSAINQVLQMNTSTLSLAREDVGSVIRKLDNVLARVRVSPGQTVQNVQPQVAVFVHGFAQQQDVVALAVEGAKDDLTGSSFRTLDSGQNISSLDAEVAVMLPRGNATQVAIVVFSDDKAFKDQSVLNGSLLLNSRVISINTGSQLPAGQHVDIVFKPLSQSGTRQCVFWNFSLQNGGQWSTAGCRLVSATVCRCDHLTHFAELITGPGGAGADDFLLDIVSVVGCSLSLVGVLGICMTGAMFRQWREQVGNKILLNLSASVGLNMLVFLVISTGFTISPEPLCIAAGALLHYTMLTTFCWMLVSAILQFIRLVSVLGTSEHVPHLLLKCVVFSWGVPLIPAAVLLAIDVHLYSRRGDFCYPQGLPFYLAVMLPVVAVLVTNIVIFVLILRRLYSSSGVRRHVASERKLALRRLFTSVLLFFLLGLSWVFGLLTNAAWWFAYLFCVTATLQGFVMFVFFIVVEQKTRRYWIAAQSTSGTSRQTATTSSEAAPLRGSNSQAASSVWRTAEERDSNLNTRL